jgi:gliding motility-associated protein GldE
LHNFVSEKAQVNFKSTGLDLLIADTYHQAFIVLTALTQAVPAGAVVALVGMLILLFSSALVSASEIAYFSLSPMHLSKIRLSKSKKNLIILHHLGKPKELLATILIANNFINLAIIVISTYVTSRLFDLTHYPVLTFILQVIVVTVLILLFGEVMPKIYATQYPLKVAHIMAQPLLVLRRLLYPLSLILVRSTSVIDKRLLKPGHNISRSDLSEAINITTDETTPEEEKKILKSIVRFGDMEVREIMKSRMDITAAEAKTSFTELLNTIVNSGYSRIPVYSESFDNILGILYVKDLIPHFGNDDRFNWISLLRPAFFIPENKMISNLLNEFQDRKIHMAVVVDEYGGTSGLVTLEDVIEEIVGEITDEFDVATGEINYTKISDDQYIFEGKILINDLCKILEIDDAIFDDIKGESDTLAGLILELEGKIPEKAASIMYRNFVFKIEAADRRRIHKIRVTITHEAKEKEEDHS